MWKKGHVLHYANVLCKELSNISNFLNLHLHAMHDVGNIALERLINIIMT